MPPPYLVLADDLTGALETGALYANSRIACAVTISNSLPGGRYEDAIVVDTEIRHADPKRARSVVAEAVAGARARGISCIYLKVDSTLRGSVAAQVDGARAGWPGRPIVFAPAYPRMGRTVRDDLLYVDGRLLADTAFASDPRDPVQNSRVSQRLSAGWSNGIIHVSDAQAFRGALSSGGASVFVCDAETQEQMRELASAIVDTGWPCVCAGSAGLLAELIKAENRAHAKTGLIVNGSFNTTSLQQCAAASAEMPVFMVDCDGGEHIATGITRAIQTAGWAVLSTADRPSDPDAVLARLASITARVLRDSSCDSLTVFGGDTAASILSMLGVHVIHPLRELLPGVPLSRVALEGRALKLVTKAGGFGDSDVIRRLREALTRPE